MHSLCEVGCISKEGLRRTARAADAVAHGGFMDPLRRTGQARLTIRNNFVAYIIAGIFFYFIVCTVHKLNFYHRFMLGWLNEMTTLGLFTQNCLI